MTCISRFQEFGQLLHPYRRALRPVVVYLPTGFMQKITASLDDIGMLTMHNSDFHTTVELIQPYHFTNWKDLELNDLHS